jgi:cytidylate kinase
MALVTISAAYGAGGSRIAPELARRLGVPFLGRPPVAGLERDADAGAEAAAGEEGLRAAAGTLVSRLVSVAVAWGTPPGLTADELLPDEARRRELEQEVVAFAGTGAGVILGRGAAVVLGDDPRALHALLDGPVDARVERAMEIEGIDRVTAQRRCKRIDRFRRSYLEDLYGVDARAPGVFDLIVDSTAMPLGDCVELLAVAAELRSRSPAARRGG